MNFRLLRLCRENHWSAMTCILPWHEQRRNTRHHPTQRRQSAKTRTIYTIFAWRRFAFIHSEFRFNPTETQGWVFQGIRQPHRTYLKTQTIQTPKFRYKGNKKQYTFNDERLSQLEKAIQLVNKGSNVSTVLLLESTTKAIKERNKVLKRSW